MTPIGTPMDTSLFYVPPRARSEHNIDRGILAQDLTLVSTDTVLRGRLGAASALGDLLALAPPSSETCKLLQEALEARSALQKCLGAVVAQRWAECVPSVSELLAIDAVRGVHATLLHRRASAGNRATVLSVNRISRALDGEWARFS